MEGDSPRTLRLKEEELAESDDEVEFIGRNNETNNASLVQSDTSSEYESAFGFSQELFSLPAKMPAPRRSNRKAKGKKQMN